MNVSANGIIQWKRCAFFCWSPSYELQVQLDVHWSASPSQCQTAILQEMAEAGEAEPLFSLGFCVECKNHQDRSEKIDRMNKINLCLTTYFITFSLAKSKSDRISVTAICRCTTHTCIYMCAHWCLQVKAIVMCELQVAIHTQIPPSCVEAHRN